MAEENKKVEKQDESPVESTQETPQAVESAAEITEKVEEVTEAVEETVVAEETAVVEEAVVAEEAPTEKPKMEADDSATKMVGEGDTAVFEFNSPAESFDWDATDDSVAAYSKDDYSALENTYTGTISELIEKSVITGVIVDIGKKEIVVNIGSKSEGVVQASEFRYNSELKHLPIILPAQADKIFSSFHLYIIRLKLNDIKKSHKNIFEELRHEGLGEGI